MRIYKNTVSELLWVVLSKLMTLEIIKPFRLVGGTSLSLLLGHRQSVDIDLFTDAEYGSIDFNEIYKQLDESFGYVQTGNKRNTGFGQSYFVGNNKEELIKLDLYYTDAFIWPIIFSDELRLSSLEEVAAMKLEVVGNTGRKKDFWDLHELLEYYTIDQMLDFYIERYPYNYSKEDILTKLTDFTEADFDFDPICRKSKYWELIKLDIIDSVKDMKAN